MDNATTADQMRQKGMSLAIRYGMKAYLAATDFQKLKQKVMADIARTPDANFAAEYAKAWPVLKKCSGIVARYKLHALMTKDQILPIISRLTAEECRKAVDDIPDAVIIEQYEKCVQSPELQDKSLPEKISIIMGRYLRNGRK